MIRARRRCGPAAAAATATAVLASLVAAPASADIFATFDGKPFGSATHLLRKFNVTTGARAETMPPGVPRGASGELRPTLSPNGRYLAFLSNPGGGQRRVLMVDRVTGQFAELFTASEAAADPPTSPAFSQDGTKILTGRRLEHRDPSSPPEALQASFTQTDVTNFPNGPFPHQIVTAGGLDSTSGGETNQLAPFGATGLAFATIFPVSGQPGRVTVQQASGTTTLADPAQVLLNPTVSESAGVVVYESTPLTPQTTKLVSRPLAGIATAPTTALPPVVNDPSADTKYVRHPAFSPDGRYLAFIRGKSVFVTPFVKLVHDHLFVWDRLTQLLLNPDGIDVTLGPARSSGGIALELRPVIRDLPRVSVNALSFTAATPSLVGIIVQRIVGSTRVLGRRAPKLKLVGRVPLGTFKKGRHRVRWNRTVGGRRLARGSYLVTVRSVTRKGQVRDLAKPVRVRIR